MTRKLILQNCGIDFERMVKDFSHNLTHSILLQKSIPDFVENVAVNIKMTIENIEKGHLRIILDPEIIIEQSDPQATEKIKFYFCRKEKIEGLAVVRFLEQHAFGSENWPIDCINSIGTLTDFLSKICLPRAVPTVYHNETMIRVFSKQFLLGDVPPLSLSFLDKPVQVLLYHTYDNYFRIFVQDMNDNDNLENSEFFIVDLQLCQPEQFRFFTELPYLRRDSRIAAAISELRMMRANVGEAIWRDRLSDVAKHIYLSSQDFYQVPRYIPCPDFIVGPENQTKLEPPLSASAPNMADFLETVLSSLIRCSFKYGLTKFSHFSMGTCLFMRSWDFFKSSAVFLIRDEPEQQRFRLMCRLEMSEQHRSSVDGARSLEFMQGYIFKYSYVEKAFHARLDLLDWDEKLVIFKMVVDNIEITYNKEKGLDNLPPETDHIKANRDSYCLAVQSVTVSSQKSFEFSVDLSTYTVSLYLIEVRQVPIGVSAHIKRLSKDSTEERPVGLLVSHPHLWTHDQPTGPPGSSPPTPQSLAKSFFLRDFLEVGGWDKVRENLETSLRDMLSRQPSLDHSYFLDSLECFI